MSDVSPEAAPEEVAAVAPEAVAPEPTPIVSQQPSSASETQQPEAAPEVVSEPLPLRDAVEALLIFVKAHRTVGDSDLNAALADVEAALAAQDEQA